jgi:hypothetical protein
VRSSFEEKNKRQPTLGFGHVNDDNSADLDGGFSLLETRRRWAASEGGGAPQKALD